MLDYLNAIFQNTLVFLENEKANLMYNIDPKTRLERGVFYSPDSCWYWLGSTNGKYGHIMVNRKIVTTHRASYRIYKGDPSGLEVCHSCDNPLCVNPDHLFLATHAENMRDRDKKGRGNRGDRHGNSKLSTVQVLAIRDAYSCGHKIVTISKYFGVSSAAIGDIVHRRNWPHI